MAGRINKMKLLENYVRYIGIFGTHQMTEWGANNHCTEPTRYMRKLRERGLIKELSDSQKRTIGKQFSVEKWWYYCGTNQVINNREKLKKIGVEI